MQNAVRLAEKLAPDETNDERELLSGYLRNLAMLQNSVGKSAEALANARRSVALGEVLKARHPNDAKMNQSWLVSLTILRYPLVEENLLGEAEKIAKYVLAETEKASAADPQNATARSELSISYNDVGRVLRDSGNPREAISYHQRALQIIKQLAAETTTGEYQSNATQTRMFLAQAQLDAGEYSAALANLEQCAKEDEKELEAWPDNVRTKDGLATVYKDMGNSLAAMKQPARALEFFYRAVPHAEAAARQSPHNARLQVRLAKTYLDSGKYWIQFANDEKGRAKACELLRKSFDVWDGMRQKGVLSKFNQPRLDEAARELSACR